VWDFDPVYDRLGSSGAVRECSKRAYVFRLSPDSERIADIVTGLKRANKRLTHCKKRGCGLLRVGASARLPVKY
jgi:hypothetical protein